jgi:hypothetical protein
MLRRRVIVRRPIRRAYWGCGAGGIILLCILLFVIFRVLRWM